MNVDLLNSLAEENDDSLLRWPDLFVKVLSNMMGREADLHEMSSQKSEICCHITFERFKDDPVASLQEIYSRIGLSFSPKMKQALQTYESRHFLYKRRHAYTNPTIETMRINESDYRNSLPVRRYANLLMQKYDAQFQ